MEEVLHRMETIRNLFMETQLFCASNNSMDSLQEHLEKIVPPFNSIAYESASMSIIIKDFKEGNDSKNWLLFISGLAKAHQAQVYVGIGWAVAKMNLPFFAVAGKLESSLQVYVADGCGYFDASFKQRQTILNQQLPDYLPAELLPSYDQGIGRSLWYSCNADIEKMKNKIKSFPVDRRDSLWKGIGIAVAYVGGCCNSSLTEIYEAAGEHSGQLAIGAALAVKSRVNAGTATNDTDHCERMWFKLAADEAIKVETKKCE